MKKKKSEPLKFTVSFEDRVPTKDEFIDKFMAFAKLACDAGVDKRLKFKKYKDDEERVEEEIVEYEINRKFLSGLEKRLREDKDFEKHIEEKISKRKLEKDTL